MLFSVVAGSRPTRREGLLPNNQKLQNGPKYSLFTGGADNNCLGRMKRQQGCDGQR